MTLPRLAALVAVCIPFAVATAASKEVHQRLPVNASSQVTVESFKGLIDVKTSDSVEVRVDAKVESDPECGTPQEQQEWVDKTEISIEQSGDSVRIATNYGKFENVEVRAGCHSRPFVNYEIVVPSKASLAIRDHKSTVRVANLQGDLSLTTHKGTVDISQQEGGLQLDTHKGQIKVGFAKLAAKLNIQTFKGNVDIAVPRNAGFTVNADLGRRGELESDLLKVPARDGPKRRQSQLFSSQVNGGGPTLNLNSFKGHFRLHET